MIPPPDFLHRLTPSSLNENTVFTKSPGGEEVGEAGFAGDFNILRVILSYPFCLIAVIIPGTSSIINHPSYFILHTSYMISGRGRPGDFFPFVFRH
ncbi:MAG: hypothetical protein PHN23_06175, partial [Methanocorpusculum sp.]|nr:hypothetical protein [Methanocorpusculum sp.]